MRKGFYFGFVMGLLVLLCAPQANAAEDGSGFGVGVFVDRNVPILKFGDRYDSGLKFGATFDYELSSRTTLEFEYHHATLNDGDIETNAFYWPVDKNWYYSPEAEAKFTLNSFIMTAMAYLGETTAGDLRLLPYVAIGAGIYDYQEKVSGMIYPGQPVEPLDTSLLLQPQEDDHTPLGATLGLGMTVRQNRFGLDVRARYHMIMGDLRPMEAWDIEEVFPISVVDLRTTFKLYW
jgi:opacity protein-like surface antigen